MPTPPIVVMYVIGSMGDARAGTERSLLTLIENLDRSRFNPILVSLQDCEYVRTGDQRCEVICLDVYRVFSQAYWRGRRHLIDLMRQRRVDIVQTFFTEAHLLAGSAARKAAVPVVISSRRNLGYNYKWKERLLLRLANRLAGRFLANSQAVADAVAKLELLDRSRIDVIHNGISLEPAKAQQSSRPTIVLVANLRPVKSIETLIEAVPAIADKLPEVQVKIVGDGPNRSSLTERARQLNLTGTVEFLGSRQDVSAIIAAAHVGVLTSRSEGFSNALLEYMREGLPVVATDVGGNREVVLSGKNGFLVPVGDTQALAVRVTEILSQPTLARAMGEAGRALVHDRFSVATMIRSHQEYYQHLLSKHPR